MYELIQRMMIQDEWTVCTRHKHAIRRLPMPDADRVTVGPQFRLPVTSVIVEPNECWVEVRLPDDSIGYLRPYLQDLSPSVEWEA